MSEFINNSQFRKQTLKDIIKKLHNGESVEDVKEEFERAFGGVSASEISEAEAELIKEGVKIEEIQSLCDVHASVFKGSIEEIHNPTDPAQIPGHPLNTLVRENRKIESIIEKINSNIEMIDKEENHSNLLSSIEELLDVITIHYQKKENLIFPIMERYGIVAPPQVMWGVDDEIRDMIKFLKIILKDNNESSKNIIIKVGEVISKINEMIFKEENIMMPMIVEKFNEDDWKTIVEGSGDFDTIVEENGQYKAEIEKEVKLEDKEELKDGEISLPSGYFTAEELASMLNTLPFDITFVGKDDKVKYFSENAERTFPRTRAIIGREVSNCHPPKSVHIVEKIVEDFKAGKKDNEDFWIKLGEQYVLIRYFAIRNSKGEYLGVAEVTQNIKPLQEITGEKRLMSD